MSGHSSEEKIKILYEDSLREIRELSNRITAVGKVVAAAANQLDKRETILREDNERLLLETVETLKVSVNEVIGVQESVNKTATKVVVELLTGRDGPLSQLGNLVKQQHDALGWINKAAKFYEDTYVLKPMGLALLLGGASGGIAGGAVCILFFTFRH